MKVNWFYLQFTALKNDIYTFNSSIFLQNQCNVQYPLVVYIIMSLCTFARVFYAYEILLGPAVTEFASGGAGLNKAWLTATWQMFITSWKRILRKAFE